MRTRSVMFNTQNLRFTGRNGSFKCVGISVYPVGDKIEVAPYTSKGLIGNCVIELPASREELQSICNSLMGCVKEES